MGNGWGVGIDRAVEQDQERGGQWRIQGTFLLAFSFAGFFIGFFIMDIHTRMSILYSSYTGLKRSRLRSPIRSNKDVVGSSCQCLRRCSSNVAVRITRARLGHIGTMIDQDETQRCSLTAHTTGVEKANRQAGAIQAMDNVVQHILSTVECGSVARSTGVEMVWRRLQPDVMMDG